MFINDVDSLLNSGETLNSVDSSTKAVASSLALSDIQASSNAQQDSLSSMDVTTAQLDQTMAAIEASAITLSGTEGYQFQGHTYLLTEQAATWEEAQAEAQRWGGNLVTINDAAEDSFLTNAFGADTYWIGISDRNQEGVFEWASGEAVGYTNWAAGEPDDYAGTQDYGTLNYGDARQWNDEHGYRSLRGIVELSSADVSALESVGLQAADANTEEGIIHNGSRYVLIDENLTWEEAQSRAEALGGNLATVNSAAEEQWIKETFGDDEGLWIGISDRNQEGVFEWASGEAVGYTNWAAGEPDDYAGTQDYGTLNYGDARQWNDEHSYTRLKGVVEIKLDSRPIVDSEPPAEPTPQPSESLTYNGSEYLLLDEALTWEEAQARAQSLGGNLVTVNDAAEEAWLKQSFSNESAWIGISDSAQEGDFRWASGEAVDYTNWAAGEPDDYAGTQDYGTLNYGDARQWNDEHSYTRLKGIVEIKLNGENEPVDPPVLPETEDPDVDIPVVDPETPNPETPNPEKPQGWVTNNGSQYLLLEDYQTWDEAQAQAQFLGGNLVTINNATEEQWLKETFGTDDRRWIGINDKEQEGVFTWASGEAVTYTNWAPGEPYDWQGVQDVGVMNAGDGLQWDDDSVFGIFQGIVEVKLNTPDRPIVDTPPTSPTDDEDVYNIYADAFTRLVPDDYSGYNANAVELSDWSNIDLVKAFANAAEGVGAQTLRIPGGDTANYWDWDIGGVVQWSNDEGEARPTWTYPYFLPESLPLALNWEYGTTGSIENMKTLFTESGASPLWVVNMNTSDLAKEMRHLQEALAAGYDIERIELGNELYFGIQNYVRPDYGGEAPQVGGTPTARDYAAQAKEWALAIRSIPGLEDATIAVTGVSPEHVPERRGVEWWPALLEKTGPDNRSAVDVVDAFTLHPYYSTNDLGVTKGDVGNWNRAGEIAREGIAYLRDTLEDPALHHAELKDKEMWITEHNIIEDAVVVLGGTWLQALMLDTHTQEFLKDPRVTASYAHILTGNAQWQGITDEYGLQIDGDQRGIADRPFTTDASDAFEPTAMGLVLGKTADVFDEGTATLLKSGEAFIAWQVDTGNGKDISAVNANSQSDTLVLPEGETWEITTYKANPWDTVYGEDDLQVRTQTLGGGETLTIDAFTKVIATAK